MVEPEPHPDTVSDVERLYFDRVAEGVLPIQRCGACDAATHPPRLRCPECYSADWGLEAADGTGSVVGYTAVRRPAHERFAEEAPITSAIVALDEGPQVMGLVDAPVEAVSVGTEVRLDPSNLSADDHRLAFEVADGDGSRTG